MSIIQKPGQAVVQGRLYVNVCLKEDMSNYNYVCINVPVVYMARYVMILMWAIPFFHFEGHKIQYRVQYRLQNTECRN